MHDPGYIYIKVKHMSLAEEARIIRRQERLAKERNNRELRLGLAAHRRGIVRWEARHALLAYAFLRGTPYKKLEPKVHAGNDPDFEKVKKSLIKHIAVRRYDNENYEWLETNGEFEARKAQLVADFDKWVKEAKA